MVVVIEIDQALTSLRCPIFLEYIGLKDLVKSEVDKEMKRMPKVGLDDPRVPGDLEPFVRDNRFDKYPSIWTS